MQYVVEVESAGGESFAFEGEELRSQALFGEEPFAEDLRRYRLVDDGLSIDPASAFDIAYTYRSAWAERGVVRVTPDVAFTRYDRDFAIRGGQCGTEPPDKAWALEQIHAPEVWEREPGGGGSTTGAGIRIGHPDTGYTDHPEMKGGVFDLAVDEDFLEAIRTLATRSGEVRAGTGRARGASLPDGETSRSRASLQTRRSCRFAS